MTATEIKLRYFLEGEVASLTFDRVMYIVNARQAEVEKLFYIKNAEIKKLQGELASLKSDKMLSRL